MAREQLKNWKTYRIYNTSMLVGKRGCRSTLKTQFGPRIVPKIGPKSIKNRSKIGSGTDFASETLFGPILVHFGSSLGPSWGPSWGPCWPKKSVFGRSRRHAKTTMISNTFRVLLGPILERFGVPKSNQNRSKIGLKSDHEANAKILKIIGRGSVFEEPRA